MINMYCNDFTTNYSDLLARANIDVVGERWRPIGQRVLQSDMSMFYQYVNNIRQGPTDRELKITARRSDRIAVNAQAVNVITANDSAGTRSTLMYRAAAVWNKLPDKTVDVSLKLFKQHFRFIPSNLLEFSVISDNYVIDL